MVHVVPYEQVDYVRAEVCPDYRCHTIDYYNSPALHQQRCGNRLRGINGEQRSDMTQSACVVRAGTDDIS